MREKTKAKLVIIFTVVIIVGVLRYGVLVTELNQLRKENQWYEVEHNNLGKKVDYYERRIREIYERNNLTVTRRYWNVHNDLGFTYWNATSPIIIDLGRVETITLRPLQVSDLDPGSLWGRYGGSTE